MLFLLACTASQDDSGTTPDDIFLPDVSAATFVAGIDHPFLPYPVGATWSYEHDTDEGLETIVVEVTADTRDIEGVTATVVRDTVSLEGDVIEDTWDWYAQDSDGNVWYLGEDTCEYEDGLCVSTEGAWEWGVDGALPGWALPADLSVTGQAYYQEYYVDHAMDVGEVIETGVSVTVPTGDYSGCVTTRDINLLDPGVEEHKTYCEGIGFVQETIDGGEAEALVSVSGL